MARNRGKNGRRGKVVDHEKNLKTYAICGYVLVALNAVVSFLFNYYGLIDCAILLALLLGAHKKRNKLCAIGLLAFTIFNVVMAMVNTGSPSGWWWIIVSVGIFTSLRNIGSGSARSGRAAYDFDDGGNDDFDF